MIIDTCRECGASIRFMAPAPPSDTDQNDIWLGVTPRCRAGSREGERHRPGGPRLTNPEEVSRWLLT